MNSLLDSLSRWRKGSYRHRGPVEPWVAFATGRPTQGPPSRFARRVERLDENKTQVATLGCLSGRAEVSKPEDCERVVEQTVAQLGKVHVLTSTASIGRPTDAGCQWVTVTLSSPARPLAVGRRCQKHTSAGRFRSSGQVRPGYRGRSRSTVRRNRCGGEPSLDTTRGCDDGVAAGLARRTSKDARRQRCDSGFMGTSAFAADRRAPAPRRGSR